MNSRYHLRVLVVGCVLSLAAWYLFTYPQLAFIDLSVTRQEAQEYARTYLRDLGVDPTPYKQATVFIGAGHADRYLQKAMGFRDTLQFCRDHELEFFLWKTRFYKENEKEEYRVTVSAKSGEVTSFRHVIKDNDARTEQSESQAKKKAVAFLKQSFQFDPDDYELHSNLSKKRKNRTDYTFVWEKKGIYIPWSEEPETGGAIVLTGVTLSGDEILVFNKNGLQIPDEFNRHIASKKAVGHNLAILFRLAFFAILTSAIFYVVVRLNNLIMHSVKHFCVGLTLFIFVLKISAFLNSFEGVLFHYSSTSSFVSYLWRVITKYFMDTFIVTISILMPCLAGESLHHEIFPEKRAGSFLYYLRTSFLTRKVSFSIVLGYLVAVIMIGIQSAVFEFGQRYLGVWVEHMWMAQLSGSYFPFIGAFILGFVASSTEEIAFRLFSISLGRKFLKSTFWAVLLASIIWGYGHSTYMVFPMWFRGLEVTLLGLFLSWMYLRYGIIPVLVGHFLFDVFWYSAPYLLGRATPFHFYSSLGVAMLPLGIALLAYVRNKATPERPLRWRLNPHQVFNLEVLKEYLRPRLNQWDKPREHIKKEIMTHGWDLAVVEMALEDLLPEGKDGSEHAA